MFFNRPKDCFLWKNGYNRIKLTKVDDKESSYLGCFSELGRVEAKYGINNEAHLGDAFLKTVEKAGEVLVNKMKWFSSYENN